MTTSSAKIIEGIIKEFDKRYKNSSLFECWDGCEKDLNSFLRSSLSKAIQQDRQEIRERIGGMKKSESNTTFVVNPTFPYAQRDYFDAYNQAITDILKL